MKLGRRSPKNAPALRLGRALTGAVVPPHPAAQDNLAALPGWEMLGNDACGDCVAVTWSNFRRLVTAALAGRAVYPTQDQVWALYRTQNPTFDPNGDPAVNGPGSPADGGMDIQTCLEHLHTVGGPDGVKAVAFAKVDFTNLDEVKAALAIFGGVWTGINVQQAQIDQFNAGQAWDWVDGQPLAGGHSVLSGGYSGVPAGDVTFVTWAAETAFSDNFWANGVEEAWVVVWPEHLGNAEFQAGLDLAALAADYQDLTGQPLPLPDPAPPAPTPVPPEPPVPAPVPPAHDPADLALVAALGDWPDDDHFGENAHAAHAIRHWMHAKGL